MIKFIVAGLKIKAEGDINQFFIDRVQSFSSDFKEEADINIHCEYCDNIETPAGKIISRFKETTTYYDLNNSFGYYNTIPGTEIIYISTLIIKNNIFIKIFNFNNDPNVDFTYPVLNTTDSAVRYAFLDNKTLVLHSSSIAYNNSGVAFSAPSGTGKSTHTALWLENYPAVIINDDSPIIRFENNKPYIYGSPWAGSTGISNNIKVPLKAIIFLEQAPVNTIEKISNADALVRIRSEIKNPHEKNYLLKTLEILDTLLINTDCYLLKCTPDKRASDLVKNTIF